MGVTRARLLAALALFAATCRDAQAADATSLLQHPITPSSKDNHKGWDVDYEGKDLLTLVGKVVGNVMKDYIGPSTRKTRLVSFGVIRAEPGAEANATLPGARCSRKEGALITDCFYEVNSPGGTPEAHFWFGKPLSDLSTMTVHANVTLKLAYNRDYMVKFDAYCKACGEPCKFVLLKKVLQWNVPDCPLPVKFDIPLFFPDLDNLVIDVGTELRRADTPAVGYATRVES